MTRHPDPAALPFAAVVLILAGAVAFSHCSDPKPSQTDHGMPYRIIEADTTCTPWPVCHDPEPPKRPE